jgi:hypothetical protein
MPEDGKKSDLDLSRLAVLHIDVTAGTAASDCGSFEATDDATRVTSTLPIMPALESPTLLEQLSKARIDVVVLEATPMPAAGLGHTTAGALHHLGSSLEKGGYCAYEVGEHVAVLEVHGVHGSQNRSANGLVPATIEEENYTAKPTNVEKPISSLFQRACVRKTGGCRLVASGRIHRWRVPLNTAIANLEAAAGSALIAEPGDERATNSDSGRTDTSVASYIFTTVERCNAIEAASQQRLRPDQCTPGGEARCRH